MDDAAPRPRLTPRQVPARTLPAPTTVSPQLQRIIVAAAEAPAWNSGPPPATANEWRAWLAPIDGMALQSLPAVKAMFPCQIIPRVIAGVTVREVVPASLDPAKAGRVLIHLHGGGYIMNGGELSVGEAILGAHYARTRVLCVDYRMPPEHPFPAAVDDAVAVWKAVIAEHAPASVGVFGTSAGGGLLLAMALKLKALGLPLPGALAPCTPWTDLTGASDSYAVNAGVDGVFSQFDDLSRAIVAVYAGETPIDDPLISPVNGDFAGFPPTIFTTGTRDLLLSDTVRCYRRMRAAGVEARLEVHEAMSHAEYAIAIDGPESAEVYGDIARFFERHLA